MQGALANACHVSVFGDVGVVWLVAPALDLVVLTRRCCRAVCSFTNTAVSKLAAVAVQRPADSDDSMLCGQKSCFHMPVYSGIDCCTASLDEGGSGLAFVAHLCTALHIIGFVWFMVHLNCSLLKVAAWGSCL